MGTEAAGVCEYPALLKFAKKVYILDILSGSHLRNAFWREGTLTVDIRKYHGIMLIMNIKKLQRQAAAVTDALLTVSEDIGKYVISAYGNVPGEMFAVQCRIQRERVRRLAGKVRQMEEELAGVGPVSFVGSIADGQAAERPFPADAAGQEQAGSIALTRQLLYQNRLLLAQKEQLLEDFLAHAGVVEEQLKTARDMDDEADVLRLKNTLRRELALCRNEEEEN